MKPFMTFFSVLLFLTVFFGVKDLTVETVLKTVVDKGWGTVMLWIGGEPTAQQNRQLPQGQGDDSEPTVTPVESLEDVK